MCVWFLAIHDSLYFLVLVLVSVSVPAPDGCLLFIVLVPPSSFFFSLGSRDWVVGGAGERLA